MDELRNLPVHHPASEIAVDGYEKAHLFGGQPELNKNTSKSDLEYSRKLGAMAAADGETIVSGGARGVDEAAMLGALEVEGTVIGVLANGLLRACSSAKYRRHLMDNNLVLISPFYPDAGFNVGNAMQRNKYIYSLADAAMVVHSGASGGTWTGAKENLRKQWVPLWVKQTDDAAAGNAAIVEAGGCWVSGDINAIDFPKFFVVGALPSEAEDDLFASQPEEEERQFALTQTLPKAEVSPDSAVKSDLESATDITSVQAAQVREVDAGDRGKASECEQIDFYDFFLMKAEQLCSDSAKTAQELAELLAVNKTQINAWLKQAAADGKMQKLSKPVRYEWSKQESLML